MDEILSSIRQIIADDDAAAAPKKPAPVTPTAQAPVAAQAPRPFSSLSAPASASPARAAPLSAPPAAMMVSRPEPEEAHPAAPATEPVPEPLTLSAEQILSEEDDESVTALNFADILGDDGAADEAMGTAGAAQLVDPDDIAFEADDEPEAIPAATAKTEVERQPVARSALADVVSAERQGRPQTPPRPSPSVAQAAPMPDAVLSADIAEQLLEPTTTSAVRHAFSRLSGLSMVSTGVTIEDMMRDMLRPMLKEWLDENLPAIVERMVEKEIARISRGTE